MGKQVSNNLVLDIEHMLSNSCYSNQAKQIQQLVLKARENSSTDFE